MSNADDYYLTSSLFCVRLLCPFRIHLLKGVFYFMDKKQYFETVVQNQIGYEFKNSLLLRQAFVRRSYSSENGGENNEILEFIGDTVLSAAVMRYLTTKYGNDLHIQDKIPKAFRVSQEPEEFHCEKSEGELTSIKQKLVEKKTLAMRIDELGFKEFLIMGKGDIELNMAEQASVKEDLFEAILGAVALDTNYDYEIIQNVAEIMLRPDSIVDNGEEADYVRLIYEWDEAFGSIPYFRYKNEQYNINNPRIQGLIEVPPQGTYNNTNANYSCEMFIRNDLPRFKSYGLSKNEARKNACKLAYSYLQKNDLLLTIRDEIEEPSFDMAINQLEILARRGYFSLPKYEYAEFHDKDGNPIWRVECRIDKVDATFETESSSKKQAKKEVAFEMLKYVLDNYKEE
ncbi:MAG: hypothetical protein E7277_00670 [Lachnospiraceae bacterium]|nr:hypothetical protein [Lachnospiraceae bacterium]